MDFNIVLVIVIGIVILGSFALWLGRGLRISKDKDGITLETEATQPQKTGEEDISVGKNLEIEGAATGDVAGIKGNNLELSLDDKKKISVLEGGKIKDSNIGDIVGIKAESSDKERK